MATYFFTRVFLLLENGDKRWISYITRPEKSLQKKSCTCVGRSTSNGNITMH